jgi:hypothetical protein
MDGVASLPQARTGIMQVGGKVAGKGFSLMTEEVRVISSVIRHSQHTRIYIAHNKCTKTHYFHAIIFFLFSFYFLFLSLSKKGISRTAGMGYIGL